MTKDEKDPQADAQPGSGLRLTVDLPVVDRPTRTIGDLIDEQAHDAAKQRLTLVRDSVAGKRSAIAALTLERRRLLENEADGVDVEAGLAQIRQRRRDLEADLVDLCAIERDREARVAELAFHRRWASVEIALEQLEARQAQGLECLDAGLLALKTADAYFREAQGLLSTDAIVGGLGWREAQRFNLLLKKPLDLIGVIDVNIRALPMLAGHRITTGWERECGFNPRLWAESWIGRLTVQVRAYFELDAQRQHEATRADAPADGPVALSELSKQAGGASFVDVMRRRGGAR